MQFAPIIIHITSCCEVVTVSIMNRFFEDASVARDYLKYRPEYSLKVTDRVVGYLAEVKSRPFEFALDVGCGSGQLTRWLASNFKKVLGVDISPAQIAAAKTADNPPNVSFTVGQAESLPAPDASVELITSATASHYFDWVAFGKEVDRVLKPSGCLAILAYDLIYLDHPDAKTKQQLTECIDSYSDYVNNPKLKASTPTSYQHFQTQYEELPLPYSDQTRMTIELAHETTIVEFIECSKTFALGVCFLDDNPESTHFVDFQKNIMDILGGGDPNTTKLTAKTQIFSRLARKPNINLK